MGIITDCCHSGSITDMPYDYDKRLGRMKSSESTGNYKGKAVLLTGCKDTQCAGETALGGGKLTAAFLKCLDKKGQNVSVKRLLDFCEREISSHKQKPCLSASYDLDG